MKEQTKETGEYYNFIVNRKCEECKKGVTEKLKVFVPEGKKPILTSWTCWRCQHVNKVEIQHAGKYNGN